MTAAELAAAYRRVRARTVALAAPLSAEDQQVQPTVDASPTKWHLAHTTWFFEELVLADVRDARHRVLFNSYYDAIGARVARARRGLLTRPSLADVHAYRADVDRRIAHALAEGSLDAGALARLELGLHHEQQHQELVLTDLKVMLGTQPLQPAYRSRDDVAAPATLPPTGWRAFAAGTVELGAGPEGFAFDNERPRHRVIVGAFELATRPIANADVLAFITAGGYREPRWWLSDGWHAVEAESWTAPMYWRDDGTLYDLAGVRAIDPAEIACHLSYYEADAIARWLGGRLPTEAEWELAATGAPLAGRFAEDDRLHPGAAGGEGIAQLFGDVWEWTTSAYSPYPGFRPLEGALGEYNGKFMSGQQVLRGGSCFTPRDHVRATYRNFFPPAARWQMTGARIARDM